DVDRDCRRSRPRAAARPSRTPERPPRLAAARVRSMPARAPAPLLSLEYGLALLEPRAHALLSILGRASLVDEQIDIVVWDVIPELHLTGDEGFHRLQRERRVVREALDDGVGRCLEVSWLCKMRDQAQVVEVLSRQGIAEQQDLLGNHRVRHLE